MNFQFVGWFPVFFSDPFPQIFGTFPVFRKVINFQFVGRFAFFWDPFPHILGSFPVFKKSYEFPVC